MGRLAAWSRGHVLAVDSLLAVGLTGVCLLMSLGTDASTAPGLLFATTTGAMYLWSAVLVAPLALRRWRPQVAAWLFVALCVVHLLLGPAVVYGDVAALIALYSVLAYGDGRHSWRFVVTAMVMTAVAGAIWAVAFNLGPLFDVSRDGIAVSWTSFLPTAASMPVCPVMGGVAGSSGAGCGVKVLGDAASLSLVILACVVSAIVLALWRRSRIATLAAMRERNAAIAAREEDEKRIAASAERARIARDMHDVVAHTLSTIIIQADGGRYAGVHDPDVARRTMAAIRHEAVHARHDMHRLFDVFDARGSCRYADVPALLDGRPPVVRHVEGEAHPDRLSPEANDAVFRLVQEALSNVRRHAGPDAHVTMEESWSPDSLRIVIHDDGVGGASLADGHRPGYGLLGMRERIGAVGGSVEAAPDPRGGFTVDASIPLRQGGGRTMPKTGPHGDDAGGPAADGHAGADVDSAAGRSAGDATAARAPAGWNRFQVRLVSVFNRSRTRDGSHGSWVGRIAAWTDRHYLLLDVVTAAVAVMLLWRATFNDMGLDMAASVPMPARRAAAAAMTAALLAPFALRRRFPESSALVMAVMCAGVLFAFPAVPTAGLFALPCVHAAVLYGRDGAWRWVMAAVAADSWLMGVKIAWQQLGYGSLAQIMLDLGSGTARRALGVGMIIGLLAALPCLTCMVAAAWRRSSGSDVLVLRQREEALRAEESKQKVLAANMERERIGAATRSEVASTLDAVIAKADEGLSMFGHDDAPSPELVSASFAAIGGQGREALAHMRRLLTTLRETGFSDDAPETRGHAPLLRPSATLDDQIAAMHKTRA